jgi:hypothetical protein
LSLSVSSQIFEEKSAIESPAYDFLESEKPFYLRALSRLAEARAEHTKLPSGLDKAPSNFGARGHDRKPSI